MGTLDIILLVCFLPALYTGLTKGFVQQIISLISLVGGAWLSIKFSDTVTAWLAPYLTMSESFLHIFSFVLIFIASRLLPATSVSARLSSTRLSANAPASPPDIKTSRSMRAIPKPASPPDEIC